MNKKDLKEPNKNSGILNYNRDMKVSLGFSNRSKLSEDSVIGDKVSYQSGRQRTGNEEK